MADAPTIYKNFHSVFCGKKVVDYFKIENTTKGTQKIEVTSSFRGKPEIHDDRLQIHPLRATVLPGRNARFTITYQPVVENVIDNHYYKIIDEEKLICYLNIRAQSVGPVLHSSLNNLKFFHFQNASQLVKYVDVKNESKCEAKFFFDLDEDNRLFDISQTSGVIKGETKITLKITFKPIEPGTYYKQLVCLVQYQKPIIFNVLGIYKPRLNVDPKSLNFKYPPQANYSSIYEAYFTKINFHKWSQDEMTLPPKFVPEPVLEKSEKPKEKVFWSVSTDNLQSSSSKHSIEKGPSEIILTASFIDIRNICEVPKATALVNLSRNQNYFYQWDHDAKNHFQIEPCRGVVEPNKKSDFSVYFTPSTPDSIYHIEADLRIFPCNIDNENESPQSIDLPLTMALRIIGNSFPDDSYGWLPQCTLVPKSLQLPSCVPEEMVYGTFMIERQGHLPVTFYLSYPKDSSFTIQPPLGYISGSFQLFVVQFNGKSKERGIYKEEVKIMYNKSSSNYDTLTLTALVEIPKIIFGIDNSFTFETTFPGSRTMRELPMENPTTFLLSYEFKIPDDIDWIEIPTSKGFIEPMSFGSIHVIFKPETPCQYLDYIPCHVSSVSMTDYVKTIYVQFVGSCQFGYLVATPSIYDFEECVYTVKKKIKFHLFNFSQVLLHFELFTVHGAFPIGDIEKDVTLTPNKGILHGKCSKEVELTITPHDVDVVVHYDIMCQILQNDSDEALPCEEPKKIFSFRFIGILPSFQIKDVNLNGGGPLFSPHWIWKMFSIDSINLALKSLEPEQKLRIRLPEAEINSEPITIALLLRSNRFCKVSFKNEKKIFCSCNETSDKSDSDVKCLHEKAFLIAPTEVKIDPNASFVLLIVLSYQSREECFIEWTIHLPFDRKIILETSLLTFPEEEFSYTSMYLDPTLNLKPVFIGDPEPPLQLFWLYNNSHRTTSYIMDKTSLQEVNKSVHRILDCLNPIGVLPPFSCLALEFVFKPNEITSFSANVSLCLKEGCLTSMALKGEGVPNYQKCKDLALVATIPEKPMLHRSNVPLECNVTFINISHLRSFSEVKRIFFLRNRSTTEEWAFQWHGFRAEDLIRAYVQPSSGVMKPSQEITLTLTVHSYYYSSSPSFSIPCDVINYSKLKSYESALRYQDIIAEKFQDNFTITEKGISYEVPEIRIPEKPEKRHIFLTVNANIINDFQIDKKLTPKEQIILKARKDIETDDKRKFKKLSISPPCIQLLLEKLFWDILNREGFKEKIKALEKFQEYTYLHIAPQETGRDRGELLCMPSKNYIQGFLENTIKCILKKKLMENQSKSEEDKQVLS